VSAGRTFECPWSRPGITQLQVQRHQEKAVCSRLIDDEAGYEPTNWTPWTHRPYCFNATNYPSIKYCVYTDSCYGNHGISIITTPRIAAHSNSILDDPEVSGLAGLDLEVDPPYYVADVPGKGKGVIASRLIKKGEQFMVEFASMMASTAFPGSVKQAQGYRLLHRATDQLVEPERVLTLGRSSTTGADIVEDVMRTNSFAADLAGVPHMALYPKISVCELKPYE
jgi:hypothetical protein